ncbi:MAG: hypothetical protein H0U85_02875 [Gemmatimonadales bacterium]|nr:hypothetical protein [Gemmatimonadales bacterium]
MDAATPLPVTSDSSATTLAWARRNAQTVTALAVYVIALGFALAVEFIQDTWLAIAGGRDIAHHGLPWHERLTVAAHGQPWVDQQWLGKLFLYFSATVGGVRLLAFVHIAVMLAALLAAITVARRRGASDAAVFWVVIAVLPSAPWGWQLRSQILAYPLFIAVLAIVTSERLKPSTRVLVCTPLLVLWANVHGSVTLGAVLVAAVGVIEMWRTVRDGATARRLLAAVGMLLLPAGCLFASPYGFHLLHYYQKLLANPLMSQYVDEWRAPTFRTALIFFALVAVVLWLVARHGRILTPMERFALLLTTVTGFTTIRGIVWFGLVAIVVVPKLVDRSLNRGEERPSSPLLVALAVVCVGVALALLGTRLAQLPRALAASHPDPAAQFVGTLARENPNFTVFASERYADWLLWKEPQLSGRLVYDIRFELFDSERFAQLADFHVQGERRDEITDGARLLVLDARADALAARNFAADPGAKVVYRDGYVVVIERPSP